MPVNIGGPGNINGQPIRMTGDAVGGVGPDGNYHILSTDNTGVLQTSGGGGGGGTVNQGTPNTPANSWPVEVTDGTNVLGTPTHPLRVDPTGTTIQPVSGTVAATQSTSPWVDNVTQVAGITLGATAVTNFGSAPAAAAVPGVNSSLFSGTTPITNTAGALDVNLASGVTLLVAGQKTNNGAAPNNQNIGVLPAIANASAPSWTEGRQVLLSTDLSGNLRTSGTSTISGTVGVTQSTSPWVVSQGTASSLNATVVNSGTFAVQAAVVSVSATGASVPADADYQGVIATTAYPTAASAGNLTGVMGDKAGRPVVVLNTVRDLVGTATLDSSSSSAVSFIAAGGSGVFNDIITLVITNDSSTATIVTLTDNGSGGNSYKFAIAANGGLVVNFNSPLPQGTSNAAWDVLNSAAVSLHYVSTFAKNH